MWVPLVVLAVLATIGGLFGVGPAFNFITGTRLRYHVEKKSVAEMEWTSTLRNPYGSASVVASSNTVQALLCLAGFLCCVPMALPTSHLVAFCSDLGIPAGDGAAMLSVLLGSAFVSRQFWGAFADRYGGLRTIFAGSACQALAPTIPSRVTPIPKWASTVPIADRGRPTRRLRLPPGASRNSRMR